jgi:rieske iron-sulfur protein
VTELTPILDQDQCSAALLRRDLLRVGPAATLVAISSQVRAESDDPASKMRPQVGDFLVRSDGEGKDNPIAAADLTIGDPPVLAWAVDPASKVLRDGSGLNQVLLLRFDASALGPETKPHAADGVVAYSAVCTHAQCPVSGWISDRQVLHCPCHQSEYDPRQNAKVVGGPAPRSLPALPLKVADGKLQVAGPFIGRVGMSQKVM